MKLRDLSDRRVRRSGSVAVVMSITNAYFAKTAHHPDLRVAPARGTRLVPRSDQCGILSVGRQSESFVQLILVDPIDKYPRHVVAHTSSLYPRDFIACAPLSRIGNRISKVGVPLPRMLAPGHLQPPCSIAFDVSLPSDTFRAPWGVGHGSIGPRLCENADVCYDRRGESRRGIDGGLCARG